MELIFPAAEEPVCSKKKCFHSICGLSNKRVFGLGWKGKWRRQLGISAFRSISPLKIFCETIWCSLTSVYSWTLSIYSFAFMILQKCLMIFPEEAITSKYLKKNTTVSRYLPFCAPCWEVDRIQIGLSLSPSRWWLSSPVVKVNMC